MSKARVFKVKCIITAALMVYAVLSYGFGLFVDFSANCHMPYHMKIFFYGLPMFLLFVDLIMLVKLEKDTVERQRIARKMMWLLFILYAVAISTLLFFDRPPRGIFSWEFWMYSVNLVPFKTIWEFLTMNTPLNALINIGGNLIALMPLGVFIPFLFGKSINKTWKFVLLMAGTVILIECLQLLANIGSADIDDVILNTVGATVSYIAYRKLVEPRLAGIPRQQKDNYYLEY